MKYNLDETSHLSECLTSGQSFDIGTDKDHPRGSPESSVMCDVYKQCDQPIRLRNRNATCSAVSSNRTDTKHNNTTPHLHLQTPHLPRAPVKQRHNRTFVLGHTTSWCFVYLLFTLLLLIVSARWDMLSRLLKVHSAFDLNWQLSESLVQLFDEWCFRECHLKCLSTYCFNEAECVETVGCWLHSVKCHDVSNHCVVVVAAHSVKREAN